MKSRLLLLITTFAARAWATSQIALFTDGNCQDSLRGLEGPNGYPNGTCTDLRRTGPYGSFQVVGLDPGCTGARQTPIRETWNTKTNMHATKLPFMQKIPQPTRVPATRRRFSQFSVSTRHLCTTASTSATLVSLNHRLLSPRFRKRPLRPLNPRRLQAPRKCPRAR